MAWCHVVSILCGLLKRAYPDKGGDTLTCTLGSQVSCSYLDYHREFLMNFRNQTEKKKKIQIMHKCRGNNWDLYVGRFQTVIKRWRVKLVTILFRGNNVHDSVWALECSDWQCDSCSLWLWPHPLALSSCLPLLQIDLCLMKIRIAVKEEQGLGTFFFF